MASFLSTTGLDPRQKVVQLGASPIGGDPPFAPLLKSPNTEVVGFEPNLEELARLIDRGEPRSIYLPHAIGDGEEHTLHICGAPGMNSLLEPNPEVLALFHGFPQWGSVLSTERVKTVRLDDVPEAEGVTYLMMDIQGAELMALRHAEKRLSEALVLHLEVEFLPLYKDQPLFSEVELFLRARGFVLHRFATLISRAIQPLVLDNDIYRGISQVVWADAVFVRDITRLHALTNEQLLSMAAILNDCYRSIDVAHHCLAERDCRLNTAMTGAYLAALLKAA